MTVSEELAAAQQRLAAARAAYRAAVSSGDDGRWRAAWPDLVGAVMACQLAEVAQEPS